VLEDGASWTSAAPALLLLFALPVDQRNLLFKT